MIKPWTAPSMGINASSAVKTTLREAAERGWSESYLVQQLRELVPLDERRRRALVNYRRKLRADGVPPLRADVLSKKYAKKLKTDRARAIARTETAKAQTEARHEAWGINDGAYVVRRWVSKPGACVICQALHGQTRTGATQYGVIPGPPSHPNCRCHEEVIISDRIEL